MNLGFSEMLFIFLLALIIFGPKRLPEIGRQIGKALAEFRRASNEFKNQLESEMRQIEIEEALRKQPDPAILPPAENSLPAAENSTESVSHEPRAEAATLVAHSTSPSEIVMKPEAAQTPDA